MVCVFYSKKKNIKNKERKYTLNIYLVTIDTYSDIIKIIPFLISF